MTTRIDGDSTREQPVLFPARNISLQGILTYPQGPVRDTGVILLNGGAFTPSVGRNRFSVTLARRLAAAGFPVLRFDWHGTGESGGKVTRYSLNRPFTADVLGAIEEMLRWGARDVILVGRCGGARFALSVLAHRPPVAGMAFLSLPLREFATQEANGKDIVQQRIHVSNLLGLLDGKHRRWHLRVIYYSIKRFAKHMRLLGSNGAAPSQVWLSDAVVGWLRRAVERGISLSFIYGSNEVHAHEFREAQKGKIGKLLHQAQNVQVCMLEGPVHDLTTIEIQEQVMSRIIDWAGRLSLPVAVGAQR